MKTEFDEAGCYEALRRMRWSNGIVCPYCDQRRVTTHTKSPKAPRLRYLCLSCRRTFSDLTGTPMARTNLPLTTWFRCLELIEEGRTTSQLARELRVKWDTATHMERRLAMPLNRPGLIRRLRQTLREPRHG